MIFIRSVDGEMSCVEGNGEFFYFGVVEVTAGGVIAGGYPLIRRAQFIAHVS
jgi:hypothetical protein